MSSVDQIQEISRLVNFYFPASVVSVGLLLNLITAGVFCTKNMRAKTNMSLLYVSLAVFDIMALLNSILFVQLLPSLNVNFSNISDTLCKILMVWRRTAIQTPSWCLVLITVDRFRSVCCPNKYKFLEKKKCLLLIIASIYALLMLINSIHLTFSLLITTRRSNVTVNGTLMIRESQIATCTGPQTIVFIMDLFVVLNRSYIPFMIMFALNLILTRKFLVSKRKFTTSNKSDSSSMKREHYFTFTVITMNMSFFILFTPWSLWYIVNRVYQANPVNLTPMVSASLTLAQNIAFSISYINNLSSFFNNFIFNKLFINELIRIISCQKVKLNPLSKTTITRNGQNIATS
jgi:hypothetical protein